MPTELPPNHFQKQFETGNKNGSLIAMQLLKQMEEESQESAFWLVSAISKLGNENPTMTLADFSLLLEEVSPKMCATYRSLRVDKGLH